MHEVLKKDLKRLKDFLKRCRPDMHEPDEEGVKAWVVGDHLDNAMGEYISVEAVEGNHQEFVVIIEKETKDGFEKMKFNLANLIALARMAKED